jgi:broad specificity phosphatase PhoE
MRLLLCRHAEAGNTAQADELARSLAGVELACVYTSPLARAVATARAVAAPQRLSPVVREDLRELELGAADGLSFEEYPQELQSALVATPATVRFPGGESYEELRLRVAAALAEIVALHPEETVAAVSHAGAIRAALATVLDMPGDASFRIDQSFAGVNVVDWIDGRPFVRLVNGRMDAALRAVL